MDLPHAIRRRLDAQPHTGMGEHVGLPADEVLALRTGLVTGDLEERVPHPRDLARSGRPRRLTRCPCQESNLDPRLRTPVSSPLDHKGVSRRGFEPRTSAFVVPRSVLLSYRDGKSAGPGTGLPDRHQTALFAAAGPGVGGVGREEWEIACKTVLFDCRHHAGAARFSA